MDEASKIYSDEIRISINSPKKNSRVSRAYNRSQEISIIRSENKLSDSDEDDKNELCDGTFEPSSETVSAIDLMAEESLSVASSKEITVIDTSAPHLD